MVILTCVAWIGLKIRAHPEALQLLKELKTNILRLVLGAPNLLILLYLGWFRGVLSGYHEKC